MARRAALWSLGVVLALVLWPVAFGMLDTDGGALVPPAGELVVVALFLALAAAMTFAVAYAVQWRRRRREQRASR
jgi:hypothetical protein